MSEWTFITKHGMVLFSISKGRDKMGRGKTAREIGDEVGVTERTAHKIIMDLERDGYIVKTRVGNRNAYRIRPEVPIKVADTEVGELLELLGWKRRGGTKTADTPEKAD
ncbi:MAG: winged helix DNA-binding protein [Chloroflexi bacterium]|nr:winged helix DNA-binding protein [Chloroflexota bacterium]